ncbi:MAG: hypothetical protein C5B57_01085 [Blastocatellia bacterium]|nr:MAG: hypothetical protein C5B57_01085 [Blastocatellia bacterium]
MALAVGGLLVLVIGCGTTPADPSIARKGAHMASLRFMFKEGFNGDTVVIRIDGNVRQEHGPITTRHDVDPPLAWSVDVPVDHDVVSVEVAVSTKGTSGTIRLNIKEFPQLDVDVSGNRVVLRGSQLVPSIG